ncbi:MAG TPA: NAD(P)/FAD-dependent oxidoreductase [Capillimicrobium sp.]
MSQVYDAVVIGGGHNGLIAGIRLSTAGWKVLVLERADRPGGAIFSDELTLPGFVHDGHSTNHNLFLGSPFYAAHQADLERHGLRYAVSSTPYANGFPDGRAIVAHQDVEATVAGLDPADQAGWRELDALYEQIAPMLFEIYAAPVPALATARPSLKLARTLAGNRARLAELTRLLLASSRDLGERHLATPEARAVLACWGMHLDFGPDVAGGAMFAFLECFTDQRTGMALVEGGASRMPEALAALLRERGGELRTGAEVTSIEGRGGRADAVTLAGGERIEASRAVIASVTPSALSRLLGGGPPEVRREAAAYRHGPGTMMVHLALDGPVPWRAPGLADAAYVHLAPYVDDLARTYTAATTGTLPAEPLLVVGQTSAVDPSRAPAGQHVLWVQVRAVPARPSRDEAGEIDVADGSWEALAEPYAERVLDKLEAHAPGLRERTLGRAVLTPADLEAANPNLVGGDSISGSMHLSQSFVLRPRTRTAVDGLWLTGAATWPGPGINALPGDHTAAAVLAEARGPRRPWRRAAR